MVRIFHPLLFLLARSTTDDLQKQVEFLRAENEMFRKRVPKKHIFLDQDERAKLLKLGKELGPGIRQLITIVSYSTFRRWARKEAGKGPSRKGRPRLAAIVRELVVMIAKETGWGYTRILGELKKLRVGPVCRQSVKNILIEHGLDPGPRRGKGTWSDFLRIHAKRSGRSTSSANASGRSKGRGKLSRWPSFIWPRGVSSSRRARSSRTPFGWKLRPMRFSTRQPPSDCRARS